MGKEVSVVTNSIPVEESTVEEDSSSREGLNIRGLLLRAVLILSAIVAAAALLAPILEWSQVRMDDLKYGRPRTDKLAVFVGHDDAEGIPTQLIAMNLNRRVVIIEIPGGDPSKIRTITGPYLVGHNEELATVTLRLLDVNSDSHPDLLVRVKDEEVVYINEKGAFRLMTKTERTQVERVMAAKP